MEYSSRAVSIAIEELTKLPGIGKRTAQRLVFFMLKCPTDEIYALANALKAIKDQVAFCSVCYNITEDDPCSICSSSSRDQGIICVVEEPNDVVAIERTGEYRGMYHVLGGALSPLEGVGPENIRIRELIRRVKGTISEVVLALNASAEGEATAVYIGKLLHPSGVKITRIARGVPIGGDLEYTDEVTLARAISNRVDL